MSTPLPPSSVGIGSIYSPPSSSSSSSSTKLASLRTSPIAHFVSSPNDGYGYDEDEKKKQPQSSLTPIPTTGRLIAVNARYVVYAVRKGLVRVIDRRSASKALLRGHDEKSRLVDAAFFDGQSGRGEGGEPGVFGLWDELCMVHRNNRKKGDSANNNKATTKVQSTTTAAIDMLATLGGINDQASVLIWRLHSSGTGDSDLGADKLMEIRLGGITNKIVWHPHDPNQFIVLHRNTIGGKSSGISFPIGTVATVVETAKLNVHLDEDEGHTVCEDPFSNGTKSLIVTDGRGGMGGAPTGSSGCNDIAWCGHVGLCYALTGHDDGCVRLWKDISSVGSTSREVPCMVTLDVASDLSLDDAAKRVTRVIFLSRYVTNMTSNRAITAPFIVGTAMNHTVSLWSSFSTSATGGNTTILQPACLRIFGLRPFGTNVETVSNLMSLEICPAPYRPASIVPHSGGGGGFLGGLFGGGGENTVTEEDVQPPSSFVLLAERNVGVIHAVHIDSQWVEDGENYAVAVVGFDYVTTLNCVNPIYSLAPCSSVGDVGNGTLMDERDVDLCCVQSKAVQMLSLTAGMVTPPGGWTDPSPGVTVLGSPVAVSGDELDVNDGDYEDYDEEEGDAGEDEFEDDYDVEGEGPDSGNDDEHDDDVVPTNSEPDSFSNWLCSIAVPTQKETPRAVSVPPGLSSTYLLPDQVMSSVDPPTTKNRGATSNSLSPMPPIAAISSSVANASKSSNKKNGQGGTKTSQPSSNQPIKILLKQEPKQELAFDPPSSVAVSVGSTTDIGAVLALQLKSHETQLLSSLQKTIVSEVASAVRSSFKDSQKATEQAIQRGFSSGFDTSQNSKLGKLLEKAAKDSASSAVASMQPLIMNALQQTMRDMMIPAYEAATRQMFQQTSTSLEQGLTNMSINQTNAAAPTLQAMLIQMSKMSEAIQSLSMEVAQLRGYVDANSVNQTNGVLCEPQESAAQPIGIRDEIVVLCQAQRYEEAFTKAVSASNGDVVLFACKNSDAEAVFNGDVHISQPIMICLLQQLGAVLVPATDAEDIKTILLWLQEIAVTIDPSNISIQRHVGNVVQQLLANISTKMSNCDPVFRRSMQTLVQVIRGLL